MWPGNGAVEPGMQLLTLTSLKSEKFLQCYNHEILHVYSKWFYLASNMYAHYLLETQLLKTHLFQPVMGKSQIKSYMPNLKSSNIKSQIFTSNPNLKSLKIPKSQIF